MTQNDQMPEVLKETKAPTNPLLERGRLPGETFRLPSCGVFYNNGELDADVEDGEIHIHPMTAYDEITVTSPSKLFSGDGIVEVISRCVPAVLKPRDLLAQDVDYILLCLRKVSYGPNYEFEHTHGECEIERDEDVPLRPNLYSTNISKLIAQTKEVNPMDVSTMYSMTLDNGQVLKMQPMRFDSYISLMQMIAKNEEEGKTPLEQKDMMLDQLANMMAAVDEVSDTTMIREWLEILTPFQIREINEAISKLSVWGVDTKFKITCRDCKKKMEVELPTNPLILFS